MTLTPGTPVRICHLPLGATEWVWEQKGTIRKPRAENLPLPSDDWYIVKFDDGGGKMCLHRSSLMVCNDPF